MNLLKSKMVVSRMVDINNDRLTYKSFYKRIWRYAYWKYRAYSYDLIWKMDNSPIPFSLKINRNLSSELSVGISTYMLRYNTSFKGLLYKLKNIFPEIKIVVSVNGFKRSNEHNDYLDELRNEFSRIKNTRFILHRGVNGLTTLWNEIMFLAPTKYVLMLNDDLNVARGFRKWVEKSNFPQYELCLINDSWSHFIISKDLYLLVGDFDENFKGIGFEDIDYETRMALYGKHTANLACPYIRNVHQPEKDTSYDDISGRVWGKYSAVNWKQFFRKWRLCKKNEKGIMFSKQFNREVKIKEDCDKCRSVSKKYLNRLGKFIEVPF